jgi:subtilisin family serine protease
MPKSISIKSSPVYSNYSKIQNRFLSALPLIASLCGSCSEEQPISRPIYLDSVRLTPVSQTTLFRASPDAPPFEVASDIVLVYFRSDSNSSVRQSTSHQLLSSGFVRIGFNDLSGMIQFRIPPSVSLNSAIDLAKDLPGVLAAVPDLMLQPTIYPNPRFSSGNISDGHYWPNSIDLYSAWDITTGSSRVTVSFIDTGIETQTGHFRGRQIFKYVRCSDSSGIYFDLYPSVLGNRSCSLYDTSSQHAHGTGTAGLAFSPGDDGVGGFGVDWHSRILSFDMYGYGDHRLPSGKVPFHDLDAAINVSLSAGANIVIANLGFNVPEEASQIQRYTLRSSLLSSVLNARFRNALIIMGAGNDRFDSDNYWLPDIYSSYEISAFQNNYLLVGSVDEIGSPACSQDYANPLCPLYIGPLHQRTTCNCPTCTLEGNSSFSTARGNVVELYAPGYRVATASLATATSDGNFGLQISSGTSYSAPLVAGTASLVLSSNAALAASEVKRILIETARISQCNRIRILNAGAAVRMAREISLTPTMTPTTSTPLPVGRGFGTGQFEKVISTRDGNFVAVGQVVINQRRFSRVLKFNRSLDVIWDRTISADLDSIANRAYDIVETPSGYLIVATSLANHTSLGTYIPVSVYQLTSSGVISSQRLHSQISGTIASPCPCRITRLPDGSFILFSSTSDNRSTLLPSSGSVMARFDSSANLIWSRSINPGVFFPLTTFVSADNSDFFVGGYGSIRQITTRRISGDGQPISPLNSLDEFATDLTFASNRFAFASVSRLPNSDFLSYSVDGNSQLRLLRRNSLSGQFFVSDALGNVDSSLVLGYLISGSGSNSDGNVVLFNVDSSGNVVWSRNFGGVGVQTATSIVQTSFGYVICGSSQNLAWLATLDSSGNPVD